MVLAFDNQELREKCEDNDFAYKEFGREASDALRGRLADLDACNNVLDIPIGNPGRIEYNNDECYKVDIDKDYKLIFSCNHTKRPTNESGQIDWGKVTRIKLLELRKNQITI